MTVLRPVCRKLATAAAKTDRVASPGAIWRDAQHQRLGRQSFLDLLYGHVPVIHEPGFASRPVCAGFEKQLTPKLSPYSHVAGPPLHRVGLAQFEFQAQSADDFKNRSSDHKDRYFAEVPKVSHVHDELAAKAGENLFLRIMNQLVALLPDMDVVVAREVDGRQYYSGIYRAINHSTPIHCDWSPYDSITEDWIINRVEYQAVFNLYLAPVRGGETVVYDRQWTQDLLQHRDPDTYGYFPEAVAGCRRATIQPRPGDLWFFNSRNLHEVKEVESEEHPEHGEWKRPRLTLSSFLGLLPAGVVGQRQALIMWS